MIRVAITVAFPADLMSWLMAKAINENCDTRDLIISMLEQRKRDEAAATDEQRETGA